LTPELSKLTDDTVDQFIAAVKGVIERVERESAASEVAQDASCDHESGVDGVRGTEPKQSD